uniref:C-type lectin domain-containing protein n=1 Tax=Caenorhabditis tropicalis TaxID=1561998 RepID=A0A1I7TTR3_9PELO
MWIRRSEGNVFISPTSIKCGFSNYHPLAMHRVTVFIQRTQGILMEAFNRVHCQRGNDRNHRWTISSHAWIGNLENCNFGSDSRQSDDGTLKGKNILKFLIL